MNKLLKSLMVFQIGILMMAISLPVQAAVNIGAPQTSSGSVVKLRSSGSAITQITPSPTTTAQGTPTAASSPTTTTVQTTAPQYQTVNIGKIPLSSNGSVISLKTMLNPSNTPAASIPSTTPTAPTAPSTIPSTPISSSIPAISALTADEQAMVDMINQERIAAGVSPLKVDLRLGAVGRAKANDMKANNYFAHTSPIYGSPWAMMQQVGLTVGWAGENIAANKSVSGAMSALMQSPSHRANILDPRFTHVGVGISSGSSYGTLYVQEFLQE